jgi:uncharacterized membrane protein (DUF485 family)
VSTDTSARASVPDRLAVRARSDEFAGLRKTLRGLVFPTTVAFFLWYALHVILSSYARGFMGTRLVGIVNVAVVFGLSQFIATFLVAWYYSRYVESKTNPIAASDPHPSSCGDQ